MSNVPTRQVKVTVQHRSGRKVEIVLLSPDENAAAMSLRVSKEAAALDRVPTFIYLGTSLIVIDSVEEILYEDME